MKTLTADQVTILQWYHARDGGHGRGRVSSKKMKLIKAGLLRMENTSHYCWRIAITERGRAALAQATGEDGQAAEETR